MAVKIVEIVQPNNSASGIVKPVTPYLRTISMVTLSVSTGFMVVGIDADVFDQQSAPSGCIHTRLNHLTGPGSGDSANHRWLTSGWLEPLNDERFGPCIADLEDIAT
jgi:hypothetical protein